MALSWLRRSVTGLSQRGTVFDTMSVRIKFVMHKVALWLEVSLPVLQFSPVSINPPMLHTHFQLHVALTRRPSGRRLGTSQKAIRTAFVSEVLSLSLIFQTDEPWKRCYSDDLHSPSPRHVVLPPNFPRALLWSPTRIH
jgi:hypothetical protein